MTSWQYYLYNIWSFETTKICQNRFRNLAKTERMQVTLILWRKVLPTCDTYFVIEAFAWILTFDYLIGEWLFIIFSKWVDKSTGLVVMGGACVKEVASLNPSARYSMVIFSHLFFVKFYWCLKRLKINYKSLKMAHFVNWAVIHHWHFFDSVNRPKFPDDCFWTTNLRCQKRPQPLSKTLENIPQPFWEPL